MLIVLVNRCLLFKGKHHFARIAKMVAMHPKAIAMHFITVSVVQIILFGVQENYNGMIRKKNADGHHQLNVDPRRKCYLMRTSSIQHFVQEKRTGKILECTRTVEPC